jgi:hypothetical protein
VQLVAQHRHDGMCEASGAVAVPEGSIGAHFVVANDEDNVLRVYAADADGGPLEAQGGSGDLNGYLGTDPDDEDEKADLEGAAWLGGTVYWIGSHSRSGKKGELRPSRWQLFATQVGVADAVATITPVGESNASLLSAISDPGLVKSIRLDDKKNKELIPEAAGFNIEGLAAGQDGKSLWVGLRNPRAADGSAYVLRIENPQELGDADKKPSVSGPFPLALAGRGIRSIERAQALGLYYIVAGASGPGGSFDLYTWSGETGAAPQRVSGFAETLAAIEPPFSPEAMIVAPDGKSLQLLSDDGDICPTPKSFRSVILKLD